MLQASVFCADAKRQEDREGGGGGNLDLHQPFA